jgi:uncharacterized RDD family membrane protein YckC
MEQYQTTEIFIETPFVYGSFWERFGAAIIDGLLLSIPNWLIGSFWGLGFGSILPRPAASASVFFGMVAGTSLIGIIINWLYYALQESGPAQATLGKRALGLKVVGTNGQRITFLNATGRHFGKMISALILYIGFLMVLWDDRKQALHDKMANTFVVKS